MAHEILQAINRVIDKVSWMYYGKLPVGLFAVYVDADQADELDAALIAECTPPYQGPQPVRALPDMKRFGVYRGADLFSKPGVKGIAARVNGNEVYSEPYSPTSPA